MSFIGTWKCGIIQVMDVQWGRSPRLNPSLFPPNVTNVKLIKNQNVYIETVECNFLILNPVIGLEYWSLATASISIHIF